MSEDELVEGRVAAEKYRSERQVADAKANGFEAMPPEDFFRWAEENRERLIQIARDNGAVPGEEEALVEQYVQMLRELPVGAPFDDLNHTAILRAVVQRVEDICKTGSIPVGDGVVYGVAPRWGLEASQLAVMGTDASIIAVSQPFLPFCNAVSKAFALSVPISENGFSLDSKAVGGHLRENSDVIKVWALLLSSYALRGAPPDISFPPLCLVGQVVRIQVLKAMEMFAVAHEYGHHVLRHGNSEASNAVRDHFMDEHEADLFARAICMRDGLDAEPPNIISASGTGAVIMLGSLELVRRSKALLETGQAKPKPRRSHPPLRARVEAIASMDRYAHESDRPVFADMRDCSANLLAIVWEAVQPIIRGLHEQGIRPQPAVQDVGGWLPGRM